MRKEARAVGEILLHRIPEIVASKRIIVSADGAVHQLPFEVLITESGKSLLDSHIVSYVPSASVLVFLRNRHKQSAPLKAALAVSASPTPPITVPSSTGVASHVGPISRGVYDLDATQLPALPSANDEARFVGAMFGPTSTVLLGDSATELELKKQPLQDYAVLHFAAHGIVSTKFPARSALVLLPGGEEDGLLQAREILSLSLAAALVTLSACDTGSGTIHGQEGVASLVRPFLAAGARTVVANLWTVEDQFSLALMREFYRQLATGADIGEAMRRGKLRMLEQFGPEAVPKLWSGVLVNGDSVAIVMAPRAATQ